MARGDSDDTFDKWWKTLLGGIFFIGLGIGLYMFFDAKERSGEGFRMNAIVLLVYEILGKDGVLIVCLVIGLLTVALAFSERRKQAARRPAPPAVHAALRATAIRATAGSVRVAAVRATAGRAAASRAAPVRSNAVRATASRAAAVRSNAVRATASRAAPVRSNPVRATASRAAAVRANPIRPAAGRASGTGGACSAALGTRPPRRRLLPARSPEG